MIGSQALGAGGGRREAERDRPFRLLVFDWDGTLMDSIAAIVACTQEVIRDLGLGAVPDASIRGLIGLGLRETIDALHPGCDDATFGRIVLGYRELWLRTYRDLPLLFPGVPETLSALAEAGYLLAIATGKGRRGLDHALATSGLASRFHATRTADEAPSKPHPGMLLDILDDLGVAPAEAVMIGDSTYDLDMARSARTAALAICSGSHGREELEGRGPLACLDQVTELPRWLATRPSSR